MSSDLDRMVKAREVLIETRNRLLDDVIRFGANLKPQVPERAAELTAILQAIDAIEKAITEERKATNPYLERGLPGL